MGFCRNTALTVMISAVAVCRLLPAAASSSGGKLVLAERGKPASFTIMLPEDASPSQRLAADELRAHVRKMTGVEWPVGVPGRNGNPPRGFFLGGGSSDLGNDGFRIVTGRDFVRIEGGAVHGTLFGVNDFLERHCGCEWFSSTTEVIPVKDVLEVSASLDEKRIPAFLFRDANWWEQQHDFKFAARMKVNGFRTAYPDDFGGQDLKMDCSTGASTFYRLVPPAKHFKDHPEWFALVDGHRMGKNAQLCLTNPGLIDFITSNVTARIAKHYPSAKYYGINPNDWRRFCECPECKAVAEREETQMGPILHLVNEVASRIEKTHPDVVLHTLAYLYSLKPPKHMKPRRNVMITFCTDQCDFSKPIVKSKWKGSREFVEYLDGWKRICDKLYIWDYSANFHYLPMAFECVHVMPENFRLFKEAGAIGVFEEGHHVGTRGADAQLKLWVLAHLAWDPYQPLEPLLRRFFKGYYGAASGIARAYYDALVEKELSRDEENRPLMMWGVLDDPQLPVAFFDRWSKEWGRALERVKDDPVRTENVRWALNHVDWVRLLRAREAAKIVVSENPAAIVSRVSELKGAAKRLLEDFRREPTARKIGGMTRWSDSRISAIAGYDPAKTRAGDRVTVEDRMLVAQDIFGASRVKDPKAEDGSAIRIDPYAKGWYQSVLINARDIYADPGVRLKIRARIRVEKTSVAGEAFTAGTCDNSTFKNRQIKSFAVQTKAIPDGEYHWYDIKGSWEPRPFDVFWIGMGRYDKPKNGRNLAVDGVYVDKIELYR